MRVVILDWLRELRASYWFLPALMALAAVVLSFVCTGIDQWLGLNVLTELGLLTANQPDGARAMLSTIAGSMIGVAGVTFSMTMVTVSFAAGQIGPRLMQNFMRDRGNQVTLGTFIATFMYCLMVLRAVRSGENPVGSAEIGVAAFVPQLSLLVALLLAVCSVGVLIYFIHHVPESINVSHVIAGVGRDLERMIDTQFPDRIGAGTDEALDEEADEAAYAERMRDTVAVLAKRTGYIRAVDEDAVMRLAQTHDLFMRLQFRPGDFIQAGQTLVLVGPANRIGQALSQSSREVFAIGAQRSRHQNMYFLIDQLVEIMGRALSPGVNDPFTAMTCMDWLQSVLTTMAGRRIPSPERYDKNDELRLVASPITFAGMAERIFDQSVSYVCRDRNAALHMLKMIGEVATQIDAGPARDVMLRHAAQLRTAAAEGLDLKIDRDAIDERYQQLLKIVTQSPEFERRLDDQGWIGGSA
ncbi:MAG: DUF2254 domain-containing protein [Planctomycetota bacterium]